MKLQQRGFGHIILLAIITLVIGVIGFAGYQVVNHKKSASGTEIVATSGKKTTLKITSSPSGVIMSGNPLCDGASTHKATPYDCTVSNKSMDTVITAPSQVVIDGKTYAFSTWDGCSASNPTKEICKVSVNRDQTKSLKATYVTPDQVTAKTANTKTTSTTNKTATTSATPNQQPVCVNAAPDDNNYALCTITVTDTPATIVFNGSMGATQCGTYILTKPGSTDGMRQQAPCGDDGTGLGGNIYQYGDANLKATCAVEAACSNTSGYIWLSGIVTVSQPTKVAVKAILRATQGWPSHINPNGYSADTTFNTWATNYDSAKKTYELSAHYSFQGVN